MFYLNAHSILEVCVDPADLTVSFGVIDIAPGNSIWVLLTILVRIHQKAVRLTELALVLVILKDLTINRLVHSVGTQVVCGAQIIVCHAFGAKEGGRGNGVAQVGTCAFINLVMWEADGITGEQVWIVGLSDYLLIGFHASVAFEHELGILVGRCCTQAIEFVRNLEAVGRSV